MIAATPARPAPADPGARARRARAGGETRPRSKAAASRKVAARPALLGRPGPSVVMGVVWAALLVAAAEAGALALAVLVMPVAVVAALSGVRAATDPEHPAWVVRVSGVPLLVIVAFAPAVVLPLAALGGVWVAVVATVLLAAAGAASLALTSPRSFPGLVLLVGFAPGVAGASVVAARGQGLSEALTLLAAVCLYDMASYVTGTGRSGGPAGAIVGMVTVAVLAVFVAAVVVPPFSGRNPWILLGLVAVLAPVGVFALARVGSDRRLPALRRLDSLALAGPAWVIAVGLLLHR